jgi:hypothetical protein
MHANAELLAIRAILARCGQGPEGGAVLRDPIVMLMVAKGLIALTGIGTTAITTPTGLALLARLIAGELGPAAQPAQPHHTDHNPFPAPAVAPFKRRGEILRPVRAAMPRHTPGQPFTG